VNIPVDQWALPLDFFYPFTVKSFAGLNQALAFAQIATIASVLLM